MLELTKLAQKIEPYKARSQELEKLLSDPQIIKNPAEVQRLSKEYKDILAILKNFTELKKLEEEINKTKELIASANEIELKELAESELVTLENRHRKLQNELFALLLPATEEDTKNCIVEIRAAAGGEESALFAADLFRMYLKFAEDKGYKTELLSSHPSAKGGFKEVIFLVEGKNPFRYLRYERGVHRVQRIPITEASGRIHTSTVTVAVLPEANEVDLVIDPKDLKIDVFRASGHGGQHVNVTDSAVRITHIPTGITVSCQDERSQYKNKTKAMKILRARLLAAKKEEEAKSTALIRRSQVGTGERSEKIRTYNFPQNRVTDHRINLTLYNLPEILDGKLDPILSALLEREIEAKL
jgi:peptide chain release factor 1|uniref:Peptide chain release factor 1 n=1 Tax=candidate division WOR-3 bacterium TaxID=2052148 RepID=A0A7C6E9X9_UNCW3